MWERNTIDCLLHGPQLGTKLPTQAYALTGNQTHNFSLFGTTPNQLIHTDEDYTDYIYYTLTAGSSKCDSSWLSPVVLKCQPQHHLRGCLGQLRFSASFSAVISSACLSDPQPLARWLPLFLALPLGTKIFKKRELSFFLNFCKNKEISFPKASERFFGSRRKLDLLLFPEQTLTGRGALFEDGLRPVFLSSQEAPHASEIHQGLTLKCRNCRV